MKYFLITCLIACQTLLATPIGNPKAPKGGRFVMGVTAYPRSLNFYIGFDSLSYMINALILESLVDSSVETNDYMPLLAKSWTISSDKKTFTFKIDERARFADGKPVTAEDVKFTWDTIQNPKHRTEPFKASYQSIESCQVIDKYTVQFKAKTLHFKNFEKVAGMIILPKHFFSKGNFNKAFNKKLLGSGPYTLSDAKKGKSITLKRNKKYWAANLEQNKGRYNFDKIFFKVVKDANVLYEVFKRGDIDLFTFNVSQMWATQTNGPKYKKKWIRKLKVYNDAPSGTQGFAWNIRKPLFKDRRVRMALSHLQNRKEWIKDLFYSQYVPSIGPVKVNSEYHPKSVKPIRYSPKEAKRLLKLAGWTKVGSDGILVKDGMRFEFDMLINSRYSERFLTRYQEDLKKMGIKLNLKTVDWTTMIKLKQDRKYDAASSARSRGIEPADFHVVWGSEAAKKKGSANDTGYSNKELDKLAAQIDKEFDKKKRIKLVHQVVEILHNDQPMTFNWEIKFQRFAYWDRFSFPGKGYNRYSSSDNLFHYWWYDSAKAKRLERAMKKGVAFSGE